MNPTYVMQQLATKNDSNGNPRRVYVFSELHVYPPSDDRASYYGNDGYSHIVFTHDEGYGGRQLAVKTFRERGFAGAVVDHGTVVTDVATYRRMKAWAPAA